MIINKSKRFQIRKKNILHLLRIYFLNDEVETFWFSFPTQHVILALTVTGICNIGFQ